MNWLIDTHIYNKKVRVFYNETLAESKQEFDKYYNTDLQVDPNDFDALTVFKVPGVANTPFNLLFQKDCKNLLKTIHHEVIHAAIAILHHAGVPIEYENDETITYLSAYIFEQVVKKLKHDIKL